MDLEDKINYASVALVLAGLASCLMFYSYNKDNNMGENKGIYSPSTNTGQANDAYLEARAVQKTY